MALWDRETTSTEGCQWSLNSSSDMGHNTLLLKLTICFKTSLAMSHFTFALSQRISMQSQNSRDQSTSESFRGCRFCGLDEEWTQSPKLPDPLIHWERGLHYWCESLSGCGAPFLSIHTTNSFKPWREEAFDFKCPSFPPRVRHQGAESSLLICFLAAMGRNDQCVMGSTISMSDRFMMSAGLQ